MKRLALLLAAGALIGAAPPDAISAGADADNAYLVALYADLHRAPELSYQEVKTAARLVKELKPLGFEITTGVGRTGIVAVMRNGPGPVLLIRTDMDALPVRDETGLPYASTAMATTPEGLATPVTHACGHDIHMATWVGVARRMAAMKGQWSGTLVMIGQPAEERGDGAKAMLDDGLYTRFPRPQFALALHDSAQLPAGQLGYTNGYTLANVDSVDMTIRGRGGHGAYPYLTIDPVVIAARVVTTLQTLVSRDNDPQDAAVVTVGSIHGGAKHNIIPDEVKLQITVRSYRPEARDKLLAGIKRIADGEASAAGVPADLMPVIDYHKEDFTPAAFNTDKQTMRLVALFGERYGANNVVRLNPSMAGEDFSRFWLSDKSIESTIFWLGAVKQSTWDAAGGDAAKLPPLHSSRFAPDPAPTLRMGVDAMTTAAMSIVGKR